MRSKALLVGARAGFVGPWVNVEEGRWTVDPPLSITIECDGESRNGGQPLDVQGPTKLRAIVADGHMGKDIYLKVKQVA